jgi:hypothetical protein
MNKKINLAKLKRKADKLWSEAIRKIGHCEICGATDYLNAHHIVSRKNSNLRWNLRNGVCLCAGKCHKFGLNSVHNNPFTIVDFLTSKKPQDILFIKGLSSMPIKKPTIEDMEGIIQALQKGHKYEQN